MLQRVIVLITIASLCLLSLMLVFTTPASAGPFGLLVIFVSAYLTCLGLISFFLYGASHILAQTTTGLTLKKPIQPWSFKRAYYYSTLLAAAPVLLIGLQSVGSIGFYELILVTLFEVIGCLYITKRMY